MFVSLLGMEKKLIMQVGINQLLIVDFWIQQKQVK